MTVAPVVFILNGPNLNLLGVREPEIYGRETLAEIEASCRRSASEIGLAVEFRQSNAEHDLVHWIQEARTAADAIIINPAGFTSTSVAIFDALSMCAFPVVEVHLSNIHRREAFRTPSYVSLIAGAVICGCGAQGYTFALQRVAQLVGRQAA
jgi:3-dehydroquinate dehydratase-2